MTEAEYAARVAEANRRYEEEARFHEAAFAATMKPLLERVAAAKAAFGVKMDARIAKQRAIKAELAAEYRRGRGE